MLELTRSRRLGIMLASLAPIDVEGRAAGEVDVPVGRPRLERPRSGVGEVGAVDSWLMRRMGERLDRGDEGVGRGSSSIRKPPYGRCGAATC